MRKIQQKKISAEITFNPYDSLIPEVFKEVKQIIQEELSDVEIEHVGSSSIPGMGGSNVIDIVIIAEGSSHEDIIGYLKNIGFIDSPFDIKVPVSLKQFTGSIMFHGKNYFILLYIETPSSELVKRWITFRDYMRQHSEKVREYEEMKKKGIIEGGGKHMTYQQTKRPWINSLVDKLIKS